MCNINHPKFPCKICAKNIQDKDKAVQCDLCELWVHIKCNNLNYLDYRYLQNCDESWYCIEFCSTIFSFNSLSSNKNFLICFTNTYSNITQWKDLEKDHDISSSLKPFSNLELLVNQFSNATPENSNDPEKIASWKNHLQHLLSCTKLFVDIAVSERRISRNISLLNNLNLNNYSFEFTPSETCAGGTLLYVANHLSYKCWNDLNIYQKMDCNLYRIVYCEMNGFFLWRFHKSLSGVFSVKLQ